jgi:hypothetical protein
MDRSVFERIGNRFADGKRVKRVKPRFPFDRDQSQVRTARHEL